MSLVAKKYQVFVLMDRSGMLKAHSEKAQDFLINQEAVRLSKMQYAFRVCPTVQFSPQPSADGNQIKFL